MDCRGVNTRSTGAPNRGHVGVSSRSGRRGCYKVPAALRSAALVLGFHGLCLVKPIHDDGWYMGSLYDDGSIDCWTAYDDLYEALRGL